MKYTIKSSRLDEVIMGYIDSAFSGIEKKEDKVEDETLIWWEKNKRKMIDVSNTWWGDLAIGIESYTWHGLKSIFNLDENETDDYFKMWVEKNLGLDAHQIFTI